MTHFFSGCRYTCSCLHWLLCTLAPFYTCSCLHLLLCTLAPVYTCSCLHLLLSTLAHVYTCSCLHLLLSTLAPVYTCSCLHLLLSTLAPLYTCSSRCLCMECCIHVSWPYFTARWWFMSVILIISQASVFALCVCISFNGVIVVTVMVFASECFERCLMSCVGCHCFGSTSPELCVPIITCQIDDHLIFRYKC